MTFRQFDAVCQVARQEIQRRAPARVVQLRSGGHASGSVANSNDGCSNEPGSGLDTLRRLL
jgi:hypothetical protein